MASKGILGTKLGMTQVFDDEGRVVPVGVDGVDLARVLDEAPELSEPGTVEDVHAAEQWARARAREIITAGGGRRTDEG
jgi:ribosomal protein L3